MELGDSPGMTRAAFLAGAAALGAVALGTHQLSASADQKSASGLEFHGINYDVGTEYGTVGPSTRPGFTRAQLHGELHAIQNGLHCDMVNIHGTDVARLHRAADLALSRGMAVTIQPRPFDRPQEEILRHLARTARQAERLRRAHRPEVILLVGCEFVLFAPGIVPGETFLDRIRFLLTGNPDFDAILGRLRAFVDRAVQVARRHFHGRIGYGAATGLEEIDWSAFDIVGLDYYDWHATTAEHARALAPYRRWRKPIMILEFGCCTYEGAAKAGGMGWEIVDYEQDPPLVKPGYVRSEREQAAHLARMLAVFEELGLLSASPYQFISVDSPYSPDPRHDLDMASFGVVKVIRERFGDPASPYRWEPKLAFQAVARHNREHRRR